jgi:hypothetical protein
MKILAARRIAAFSSDMDYETRKQQLCEMIDEPDWGTKIDAVSRLTAASSFGAVESFFSKLGIDVDLVHLVAGSATYELYTDTPTVLSILTRKLGKPKTGRKGSTQLYVWDEWNPEIGVVLTVPPDHGTTLEVYDI